MTEKPGLQSERTHLAWERTAIGSLTVAGILMFHTDSPLERVRPLLAVLAILLALTTFALARSRGRVRPHTDSDGRTAIRSPAVAVAVISGGITGLSILILAAMLFGR